MIDLAAKELVQLASKCRDDLAVILDREEAAKIELAINNVLVRLETAEARQTRSNVGSAAEGDLRAALECAVRDLDAAYDAAKTGKPVEVPLGNFMRLRHMRTLLAGPGEAEVRLSAANPIAEGAEGREELKRLYDAYVRLIEIGRDRIIAAGGTCDPVDVMEKGDPALVRVRAFLAPPAATP